MKIYYFSKEIVRNENGISYFGDGRLEEYISREELIKEFEAALYNEDYNPLTEEELASIVCEEMPNYDFYTVQYWVDGFGHDTSTLIAFKTYQECQTWINSQSNEDDKNSFKIIGQRWGKSYCECFG